MRTICLFLLLSLIISCKESNETVVEETIAETSIDYEAELSSIGDTRQTFMAAVKAKDMETIGKIVTPDIKTVHPGSELWMEMYRINENAGPFPYDSIIMSPTETVIVSDTLAYDIGNSKVYYTDEEGQPVELHNSFLAILKKGEDGVWRLHREVASAYVPE